MNQERQPRYGIDPYLDWIKKEGLPVADDYAIDLFAVDTAPWARANVNAAAVHLKGRGDFASMLLFDIAPAHSTAPRHHLYEEVYYVLDGHGSTQVDLGDGRTQAFEWGPSSLFVVPLNMTYRIFNASGRNRALLVSTTNLPLIMNTFHDERFIFGCDFEFNDRLGKDKYFAGAGELFLVRPGNDMWETNFVPDLRTLTLKKWGERGAGANINVVFPDSILHTHISEIPVGTYKKAHRHHPGFHVMSITGEGYSLLWFEGDNDFLRIDWKHGVVFPPADRQFHQHFNTGGYPARYLATGLGSVRFPFTTSQRRSSVGLRPGEKGADWTSTREGGDQIDYEDQDPRIERIWIEEHSKKSIADDIKRFRPDATSAPADP